MPTLIMRNITCAGQHLLSLSSSNFNWRKKIVHSNLNLSYISIFTLSLWHFRSLSICALFLVGITTGKQRDDYCDNDVGPLFDRMFAIQSRVRHPQFNVTRDVVHRSWSPCVNPDDTFEEMMKYMESYGFETHWLRENPYSFYSDANYKMQTFYSDELKIKILSLFDVPKYVNRPIYDAGWQLVTNRNLRTSGQDGMMQAGSSIKYGVFRWSSIYSLL